MAIGIKLPTVLRPLAGAERVEVDGATVGEVVAALDPVLRRRLTDEQALSKGTSTSTWATTTSGIWTVSVTTLKDGDELMILPRWRAADAGGKQRLYLRPAWLASGGMSAT